MSPSFREQAARHGGAVLLRRALEGRGNVLLRAVADADAKLTRLLTLALSNAGLGRYVEQRRRAMEANEILAVLDREVANSHLVVIEQPYSFGASIAFDDQPDLFDPGSDFGPIDRAAIRLIAENLRKRLDQATTVVGRRVAGVLRREGLRIAAAQILRNQPEGVHSDALRERLVKQGLTSFVDRAGKKWSLRNYAEMVVRTTASEAVARGTEQKMRERHLDLVEISTHGCAHHPGDRRHPCVAMEGKTFSLSGNDGEYPRLDPKLPFHPRCTHFMLPSPLAFERRDSR